MKKIEFVFYKNKSTTITDENNNDILCNEFCINSYLDKYLHCYTYYISKSGKVWRQSLKSIHTSYTFYRVYEVREPVPIIETKTGYNKVLLKIGSSREREYRVDTLVLNAFKHNPYNKTRVRHLNGIRNDDSLENLIWI